MQVDIDHELLAYSDRAALEVVVRNLIDNAVKYSPGHVEVRIHAKRTDDERVCIEVEDKGIGISSKDLKRVFHRFYRVPEENVRARRGTGLGLFVVSALVRNLGGRVRAMSEGPGHGTTMRVELPTRRSEAA